MAGPRVHVADGAALESLELSAPQRPAPLSTCAFECKCKFACVFEIESRVSPLFCMWRGGGETGRVPAGHANRE